MREMEVKVLDIDRAACEQTLRRLHAEKIFDGILQTRFYDYPNHTIKEHSNLMRLRTDGATAVMTFKKHPHTNKDQTVKVREEYEVTVSDFETAHQILLALGLSCTLAIRKRRTSYRLPSAEVEIDEHLDDFAYIPVFMEIEAKTEPHLLDTLKAFGYATKDAKPWSFFDVADYYKHRH
jgi:predicted adenylyl cyclase CyaB